MKHEFQNDHAAQIPHDLAILPLRNSVAYPFSVLPLLVGVPRSVKLVEEAMAGEGIIGLVASRDGSVEEPQPGCIPVDAKFAFVTRQPLRVDFEDVQ